jgi:hypothetical protein
MVGAFDGYAIEGSSNERGCFFVRTSIVDSIVFPPNIENTDTPAIHFYTFTFASMNIRCTSD